MPRSDHLEVQIEGLVLGLHRSLREMGYEVPIPICAKATQQLFVDFAEVVKVRRAGKLRVKAR